MTRSETRRRIAEATKAQPDLPSTTLGDLLKEQMGAGLAASAVADDAPASTDGGDAADDEEAEKPADSE